MKLNVVFLGLYLLLIGKSVYCFIICPDGGRRTCSSSEIPFNLTATDNVAISNCIYENCPQIIIDSCVGISFKNVTFRNGNGTANLYHGGSICILGSTYQSQVIIMNSRFENIFSGAAGANTYQGGAIYATGTVLVFDTAFVNNSAIDKGGSIAISNSLAFNCTRCVFNGCTATLGGAVSINQSLFDTTYSYFIDSALDRNSALLLFGQSALGGSFYVIGAGKLYVQNCTIRNGLSDTFAGGIYTTGSTSIILMGSTVTGHYALFSGFLHIDGGSGCVLTVQNCYFTGNRASFNGACLRVMGEATVLIENNVFFSNFARFGSAMFLSRISASNVANVRNCTFDSERSIKSTLYFEVVNLLVDNCYFVNCKGDAQGGGIFTDLAGGKLTITNSRFVNVSSGENGGAITLNHAGSATIQNCSFSGCSSNIGGVLYASQYALALSIIDSVFYGSSAFKTGGDIYVDVNSVITIRGCRFYSSSATNGGSIYYSGTSSVTITNSDFYNNTAVQFGGSIYSVSVGATFNIRNSNFHNSQAMTGGSIALSTSSGVFNNASFFENKASRYAGSIYAVGATISLSNCYSVNSSSLTGGFLYAFNEVISISNSIIASSRSYLSGGTFSIASSQFTSTNSFFTDSYSENGGSMTLSTNSVFQGTGVTFDKSNANFGGCLYVDANSQMVCDGCTFSNFNAPSNGSLLYLDNESQAALSNSQVSTTPGALSGSFIFARMSSLSMVNMNANYLCSVTGSFLNAIEQSTCVFNNFQLTNPVATGVGGSILQIEGLSSVTFLNSAIIYPKAEVIFSVHSGSNLILDGCTITFTGTPLYGSSVIPDWYKQLNKVVVQVTFDSSVTLTDNCMVDSFNGNNVASIDGSFSCVNSIINNTSTKRSPLFGRGTSSMMLDGCSILNSLLDGAVDQCNFGLGVSSYGGAITSSGIVSIDQGSVIQGNVAHYGGAIAMTGSGSLTIGSGVNISNNVALLYGGAFYIDSPGPNIIDGDCVFISNNQAPTFPESSLGYFGNGYLDFDSSISRGNLTMTGGIYVFNHLVAESISQNSSIVNTKALKLEGRAKKLNFVGGFTSGMTIKVTLSQDIPVITLSAINGFNQVATVDPSNLVIVEINEINQNATLRGETIKSISDQYTKIVAINSLSILNRSQGLYTLQIRAKAGTLDFDGIDPNPLILNIIYRDCMAGSEIYVASVNDCILVQKIKNEIRSGLALLCIILIIGCISTLLGLYKYRNHLLIRANSYVYLSLPVLGCIFAFSSPITATFSCITSIFVENIGFCLIFSSLLIKLYRIRVILDSQNRHESSTGKYLSDGSMARILIIGLIITISYQILWEIFADPSPVPIFIPEAKFVITDSCHLDSSFALGISAMKFVVSIIVAYLAYMNRNVPSEFNESRYIGLSCYNWVIFGTILSLFAEFIITDPNLSVFVKGISLILSHAYTTLYLASYKVYRCWKESADAESQKQTNPELNSTSSYIKSDLDHSGTLENKNPKQSITESDNVPSIL